MDKKFGKECLQLVIKGILGALVGMLVKDGYKVVKNKIEGRGK